MYRYKVAAYASGYLPDDISITISEFEAGEYTLSLVEDELIVGDLTVRRMTLEEMVESGVDFSAPENYNRFVFRISESADSLFIEFETVLGFLGGAG